MEPQEKTIEEFKKQAEEYLAGWKRAKADFVNYQKQAERERAEWFRFANAACVKAMLPVLDSLESASSPLSGGAPLSGEDSGIAKIRDQMLDALKQLGVEAIAVAKEPPNPELHEVVGTEKIEGISSGLMAREVQRGYTLHGRLLRAAKVIVSK